MPPEGYDTVTLPTELVAQIDRRADAADRSRVEELWALVGMDDAPDEPFKETYLVQPDRFEAAVRAHGGHAVIDAAGEWLQAFEDMSEIRNADRSGSIGPVTLEASERNKIAEEVVGRLR